MQGTDQLYCSHVAEEQQPPSQLLFVQSSSAQQHADTTAIGPAFCNQQPSSSLETSLNLSMPVSGSQRLIDQQTIQECPRHGCAIESDVAHGPDVLSRARELPRHTGASTRIGCWPLHASCEMTQRRAPSQDQRSTPGEAHASPQAPARSSNGAAEVTIDHTVGSEDRPEAQLSRQNPARRIVEWPPWDFPNQTQAPSSLASSLPTNHPHVADGQFVCLRPSGLGLVVELRPGPDVSTVMSLLQDRFRPRPAAPMAPGTTTGPAPAPHLQPIPPSQPPTGPPDPSLEAQLQSPLLVAFYYLRQLSGLPTDSGLHADMASALMAQEEVAPAVLDSPHGAQLSPMWRVRLSLLPQHGNRQLQQAAEDSLQLALQAAAAHSLCSADPGPPNASAQPSGRSAYFASDACVVCWQAGPEIAALPCHHLALCAQCQRVYGAAKPCVICREGATEYRFFPCPE